MDEYPWRGVINPSDIDIVAPDGTVRAHVQGYYAHEGKMIFIEDLSIDIQPDDEVRRILPNGKEEAFIVVNPLYMDTNHLGMGAIIGCSFPEGAFMSRALAVITISM